MDLYKCTHEDGISIAMHTTQLLWNLCQKTMGFRQKFNWFQTPRTAPDVSGCILSHLSASTDIATTLCFTPYIPV